MVDAPLSGTANTAERIVTAQTGHFGGALTHVNELLGLVSRKIGFKHSSWNMCPHGRTCVFTLDCLHIIQIVLAET